MHLLTKESNLEAQHIAIVIHTWKMYKTNFYFLINTKKKKTNPKKQVCHFYVAQLFSQGKIHFTIQFRKTQQNVIHFNKYR